MSNGSRPYLTGRDIGAFFVGFLLGNYVVADRFRDL
jgi:hypothetical protein